jgi:hypothetical protein
MKGHDGDVLTLCQSGRISAVDYWFVVAGSVRTAAVLGSTGRRVCGAGGVVGRRGGVGVLAAGGGAWFSCGAAAGSEFMMLTGGIDADDGKKTFGPGGLIPGAVADGGIAAEARVEVGGGAAAAGADIATAPAGGAAAATGGEAAATGGFAIGGHPEA